MDSVSFSFFSRFLTLTKMRQSSMDGTLPISLREIDLYLEYYPVYDVYFFIDVIFEIDELYLDGIDRNKSESQN